MNNEIQSKYMFQLIIFLANWCEKGSRSIAGKYFATQTSQLSLN